LEQTSPSPAPTGDPARRSWRWWTFEGPTVALVLATVLLTELWAFYSTDPDFYLPDPFRPCVIALLALLLASAFIPWRWLRTTLHVAVAVPMLAVLVLEGVGRFHEGDHHNWYVTRSPDRLLRYQYLPGAGDTRRGDHSQINKLGLWDEDYAIPKPPGTYRVAILTGSVADDGGVTYPQRFHVVLEKELAKLVPNRKVEVLNVSCEGYSSIQQVRLLERVGLRYQPDLVIVAHMLTSTILQDQSYRRIGNSFFLFRMMPLLSKLAGESECAMLKPMYDSYQFDLIVRSSYERLALLSKLHGFKVLVAAFPNFVTPFDDPVCMSLYDQVLDVARDQGFQTLRVVDEFRGESVKTYQKPNHPYDFSHPNPSGHEKLADALAKVIVPLVAQSQENVQHAGLLPQSPLHP